MIRVSDDHERSTRFIQMPVLEEIFHMNHINSRLIPEGCCANTIWRNIRNLHSR
jgi:hypothetical protein